MGRKRQDKRWRKIIAGAERLERDNAKEPCDTCAFKDSECWVTDRAIGQKILTCLQRHDWFFCHHGLECIDGVYQEPRRPDGSPDRSKMEPCGGFVRWRYQVKDLPKAGQEREVLKLQRHFLERYLTSDVIGAQSFEGITARELQAAINYALVMDGTVDDAPPPGCS